MEGPITDEARAAMLRAALSRVDARAFRDALAGVGSPRFPVSKPIANALGALRKHRDPLSVLGRAQYRVALPYAAAAMTEPCLAAVIELLGEDADDPSREQLLAAVDSVASDFDDVTLALLLASVADGEMTASDLCFTILDEEDRFGLTGWRAFETTGPPAPKTRPTPSVSLEQRAARRTRKQRDAEERRRATEAKARAAAQVREARKQERLESTQSGRVPTPAIDGATDRERVVSPSMGRRRAVLTPGEEEEFDRDDPWSAGVIHAWVPFDGEEPDQPDLEGKVRPSVVIAGSPTHVLVRPGYSQGGVRSRDWRSTPVRYWRRSGFGEPTWIDVIAVRVARPEDGPVGWLEPDDWNALW